MHLRRWSTLPWPDQLPSSSTSPSPSKTFRPAQFKPGSPSKMKKCPLTGEIKPRVGLSMSSSRCRFLDFRRTTVTILVSLTPPPRKGEALRGRSEVCAHFIVPYRPDRAHHVTQERTPPALRVLRSIRQEPLATARTTPHGLLQHVFIALILVQAPTDS